MPTVSPGACAPGPGEFCPFCPILPMNAIVSRGALPITARGDEGLGLVTCKLGLYRCGPGVPPAEVSIRLQAVSRPSRPECARLKLLPPLFLELIAPLVGDCLGDVFLAETRGDRIVDGATATAAVATAAVVAIEVMAHASPAGGRTRIGDRLRGLGDPAAEKPGVPTGEEPGDPSTSVLSGVGAAGHRIRIGPSLGTAGVAGDSSPLRSCLVLGLTSQV